MQEILSNDDWQFLVEDLLWAVCLQFVQGVSGILINLVLIGHPGSADRVTPHVLNKPSKADRDLIDRAIDEAVHHTADMLRGDLNGAMNHLNGFKA